MLSFSTCLGLDESVSSAFLFPCFAHVSTHWLTAPCVAVRMLRRQTRPAAPPVFN